MASGTETRSTAEASEAVDSTSAAAASNTAAGGVPKCGASMANFVEHEHRVTSRGTKVYNIAGLAFETDAKYAVKKAVGQGAYGLVCSARVVETGEGVAIKKIPKAFDDIIDCKRLLREIKILKHFDHDNILGIKDILCPPSKKWKDVVRCSAPHEWLAAGARSRALVPRALTCEPSTRARCAWTLYVRSTLYRNWRTRTCTTSSIRSSR